MTVQVRAEREHEAPPPAAPRGVRRPLLWAVVPALLAVALVTFVAEPFRIPSPSMQPTLLPGDHVLVDKLAYRFGAPRRGDLAVFHAPDTGDVSLKRVVGVSGDRVGIEDGVLGVNGRLQREPYVDHRLTDSVYFGPVRVPDGHVFVIGDNRGDSVDLVDYGAVPEDELIGRVALRLWPLTR